MAELTMAAFLSLDGVMQAPGGSEEDSKRFHLPSNTKYLTNWTFWNHVGTIDAFVAAASHSECLPLSFNSADGQISSVYKARIDDKGMVETMKASGNNELLCKVKQYRVSHLTKLA